MLYTQSDYDFRKVIRVGPKARLCSVDLLQDVEDSTDSGDDRTDKTQPESKADTGGCAHSHVGDAVCDVGVEEGADDDGDDRQDQGDDAQELVDLLVLVDNGEKGGDQADDTANKGDKGCVGILEEILVICVSVDVPSVRDSDPFVSMRL